VTKLACELLAYAVARSRGLDAVGLRYFTVYGPRQRPDMAFTRLLESLATGTTFTLHGDVSRSFTFVADAVEATVRAMAEGRKGELYNVGGGDESTMTEAIGLAQRIAGRTLALERGPSAPGDMSRTKADGAKAERDLGWRPTTTLEEGMRAQWEWVAARVAAQ
jgi:nucleoside-diphosphate-sugar epimerase